jgi:hypothetical protein
VQPRKPLSFAAVALTSLLALLLIAAATLSANTALHQLLHKGSPVKHVCLVCSLAKGQVEAEPIGFLALLAVFCPFFSSAVSYFFNWLSSDFRLLPSRAPPVR